MRNEMLSFFRGAGFHEEFCVLLTFFFLIREVKKKKNDCSLGYVGCILCCLLEPVKTDLKS